MNTRRHFRLSSKRPFQYLSLALAALLALPPVLFTPQRTARAQELLVPSATIVVNTTGDGFNVDPNAGCDADSATPGEQCSLRAAIQRALALAGDDQISFNIPLSQPNCDAATGKCIINLSDELQVSTNIAITGPGADKLTVRRAAASVFGFRIFTVISTASLSLSGLTVTGGDALSSVGGAILNAGTGAVNVSDSIISSNMAAGGGGGIANGNTGTVNITDSVIRDNLAIASGGTPTGGGGGVRNANGTTNILNSIVSGNVDNVGSVENASGTLNVTNSVVSGNISPIGIDNSGGTLNLSNSTITKNQISSSSGRGVVNLSSAAVKSTIIALHPGVDVEGSFTSAGFNLIGKIGSSAGFTHPTDQTGGTQPLDPRLADIQILGVTVRAQPFCDSPASDKGSSAGLSGPLTTDVRGTGFPRTVDDPGVPNATGGDGSDVGAFERSVCAPVTFTVNTTGDADDVNPGDAVCDSDAIAAGPQCSLRAAIKEANAVPPQSVTSLTINFAIPASQPNCDATTSACTINLTRELPQVTAASLTIEGPGADMLTVRRNSIDAYPVFTVSGPVEVVTISELTVNNGFTLRRGGGILFTPGVGSQSTLNVIGCEITGNFAGSAGGGIAANGSTANLNITGTTVRGNFTDAFPFSNSNLVGGGGIAFEGAPEAGTMTITDSTISDNVSEGDAGGLLSKGGRNVSIVNSRFIGNVADTASSALGGGIFAGVAGLTFPSALNITNCQFTGNRAKRGGGAALQQDLEGIINVTGSTFSDNISTLNQGGGINLQDGTLNVVNSTINNNKGAAIGNNPPGRGGIFVDTGGNGPATITLNVANSTISGNDGDGINGGIDQLRGKLNVTNSTIVGGVALSLTSATVKSSILSQASGAFTSGGFNFISSFDPMGTGFTNGVNNDQVGTPSAPLNPKLDPTGPKDNGGPTWTIALLSGSPAIDKGTAAGLTGALTTDQRGTGFTRTFDDPEVSNAGDATDIGAFEFNPAAPTPTPTPTPTATPTATPSATPTPTVTPTPTPTTTPTPTPSPTPTPPAPTFQFDAAAYPVTEGVTSINVRVLRNGPTGTPAAVDITSEDGTAKQKGDYTLVVDHLLFAPGETQKLVAVLINDDNYAEGFEFANLILQHPENGTLGNQSTATLQINDNPVEPNANPISDARVFTGTHYHDFLYRQSDTSGEDFWTQAIASCGADASCVQRKRIDVSTAFFISIEFQQTGYLVIRAHKAGFGNLKSTPRYEVFLRDLRRISEGVIVGATGWEQQLGDNQRRFFEEFVTRPGFVAQFPVGQLAGDYVDHLFQNAGVTPTSAERNEAIMAYGSGDTTGRAAAFRSVIETGSVYNAQYNAAFVLMQYYGYLRRNPDDLPDLNFSGYDFWLRKMNDFSLPGEDMRNAAQALERARRAEMVKSFIDSAEYLRRFGDAPEGNQQGPPFPSP